MLCAPPGVPLVDLGIISVADARRLHGQRVVARFKAGAPSYTWNGRTVTGPGGETDDIERTAVLSGERVIDHPPAMVGGAFVPGWVEVRGEEE